MVADGNVECWKNGNGCFAVHMGPCKGHMKCMWEYCHVLTISSTYAIAARVWIHLLPAPWSK